MRFQNRVAIVTGGNGGMGRAIVEAFAREGCAVASFDVRDPGEAVAVRQAIAERGGRMGYHQVDVSHRAQVEAAVAGVVDEFGGLDILVNGAGVAPRVPFLELTDEVWERTLAINLKGYFVCAQVAARAMVQQGRGGVIVNISSNSQIVANPSSVAYCTSKGGIHMLTRSMALDLAPHGIRVNAVCPGPTLTDLNRERFSDPAFRESRVKTVPRGRLGQPEDVAASVLFLASDESDFLVGASLFVDGGQSLTVGG